MIFFRRYFAANLNFKTFPKHLTVKFSEFEFFVHIYPEKKIVPTIKRFLLLLKNNSQYIIMYCEFVCCFPCMFVMKTCDECYKFFCCMPKENSVHAEPAE